ncbi:MAG TPA: hypothetical protein VEL79_12565 [Vicinamibacterales bacterium]|nr:hypothetical protein [Vicinamibacterales bacterium]
MLQRPHDVCECVRGAHVAVLDGRQPAAHRPQMLANKMARIIWAVWHREVDFDAHAAMTPPEPNSAMNLLPRLVTIGGA